MRCWSTSGSFFRLVLHLNDETVQTMHKVSAAEAFCVKKKVTMKDLVDSLLRARTAGSKDPVALPTVLRPVAEQSHQQRL